MSCLRRRIRREIEADKNGFKKEEAWANSDRQMGDNPEKTPRKALRTNIGPDWSFDCIRRRKGKGISQFPEHGERAQRPTPFRTRERKSG